MVVVVVAVITLMIVMVTVMVVAMVAAVLANCTDVLNFAGIVAPPAYPLAYACTDGGDAAGRGGDLIT